MGNLNLSASKARAAVAVEKQRPVMRRIITRLHNHPELGGEESMAAALLCGLLCEAGFTVKAPIAGLTTAFVACTGDGQAHGPRIAFLAEYDALPGVGHACGHNASCAASVGAALALAALGRLQSLRGTIMVVGTPAEETLSCKVTMIQRGVFDEIDAAMMVHAFDAWHAGVGSMALDEVNFSFYGRAAHAAAAPEQGVNALDAVMLMFHGVNCLRQHLPADCRVHGIVTKGGDAANIVPDFCQANFIIRSPRSSSLDDLTQRVERCARGAAVMAGCELVVARGPRLDELRMLPPFLRLYEDNLRQLLPADELSAESVTLGSTDAGNLSHRLPTLHPVAQFAPRGTVLHSREFAEATTTAKTLDAVSVAATVLAQTALDLLETSSALARVRVAFDAGR